MDLQDIPGEFLALAEDLNREGYTVSVPLLPGHGRNREAFKKTNWKDWLSHAEREYESLAGSHSSVSIAGLSMGGVMTLILAARFGPERIALLAPAIAVNDPIFKLTPLLSLFLDERPKTWTAEEDDSEEVRALGQEYWTRHFIKQIAGLNKLTRIARSTLKGIRSPALIMVSEKDDSVPLKAAGIIEKGLVNSSTRTIVLKNSPHVLVSGPEKEYVRSEVVKWMLEGDKT
ncbi:alpha/beta fold hydrolase [Oceanispirochaeta sp.]|jgi:carboxylesterase|uniref:alpha/beta hydrolase n=1 Tax=Oceanispirochaeta sp. TaxID=2035350 RepID=UPI00261AF2FC|nr:alpha/beta fold hydrolase [Oceanispirochaeta sp.]MDA3958352.1 alpha/beta fold hydrolase [Oceanispirochaeta sp.]